MAHALGLARRGLGRVWPNPAVGCVIVAGGRIVGRGWTQPGGRPHAEAMALAEAGPAARGATAYVTLEPCAHHGQTPPCAEALVAAGLARVVSAVQDPDPRVSGRGHAILRAAGIEVSTALLAEEAARLNEGFFKRVLSGLPLVTLKLAMSLDGRIANASGASRWVTGHEARRHVHAMRARHDAVMVGIGTALADDPDLTVRDLGMSHQPLRIVVDSRLRLSPDSRLARTARDVPVWLIHASDDPGPEGLALERAGVRLLPCRRGPEGHVDIDAALAALGAEGLTRVYCEGGGTLAGSLLRQGQVDRLVIYSSGRVFGADGTAGVGPLPGGMTLGSPEFRLDGASQIGTDLVQHWSRCRG
jgi:diaminohydroxyphosphoribosylaminopyrimidine deaminase/5-amino-6-(5-phosphoribosylamino)uracil reductase